MIFQVCSFVYTLNAHVIFVRVAMLFLSNVLLRRAKRHKEYIYS